MKQLKSVETFADVICENCVSYNQGQCCQDLTDIAVRPDYKCIKGHWSFQGNIVNFRQISLEFVPFSFVTDVDDLECKNCVSYNPSKQECHFHIQKVYKSAPNDWCDNGVWLYRDNDEEVIPVSLSFFYPRD